MSSKRFLVLHSRPAGHPDAAPHPDHQLLMQRYREDISRAGVLRDEVALAGAGEGVRIRFQDRQAQVEHPPFDDEQMLTTFCTIETASREEALQWLQRWPAAQGDDPACVELRESGCPGGVLAVVPQADARDHSRRRYAILLKSDANLDADVMAPQARLDAMTRRNEEGRAEGVLLAGEGLKGSARAVRMKFPRGQSTLMDGPFTEVKEMVAGYWIIQAANILDAIDWVRRYPYPMDDAVVDIRPLAEPCTPAEVA